MPDIAVFFRGEHLLNNSFHGVILVRTEHHEHFRALIQDHILGDEFREPALFQEYFREFAQLGNFFVALIRPKKVCLKSRLLTGLLA